MVKTRERIREGCRHVGGRAPVGIGDPDQQLTTAGATMATPKQLVSEPRLRSVAVTKTDCDRDRDAGAVRVGTNDGHDELIGSTNNGAKSNRAWQLVLRRPHPALKLA